jgi:hypothetical protein
MFLGVGASRVADTKMILECVLFLDTDFRHQFRCFVISLELKYLKKNELA